jgi:hypothetical protein
VQGTANKNYALLFISLLLLLLIFPKMTPAAITVTLTPSNSAAVVGQTVTYTASWTAGVAPYTVNYFNVTSNTLLKSYTGISGTTNTLTFTVNTPPGSYLGWANTTAIPQSLSGESCIAVTNEIYCVGGSNQITQALSQIVYSDSISNTELLGSWGSTSNSYPLPIESQSCVTSTNDIYCIGGFSGSTDTNFAYVAPISVQGTVGAWTATNSYPLAVESQSCNIFANNIYCVGGLDGGSLLNNVYFAPLLGSGGIGAWQSTNTLPAAEELGSCTLSSNNIYCVGGITSLPTGSVNSIDTNTVYYAPIFASNVVGAWTQTSSYGTPVDGEQCTVTNSILVCVGGEVLGGFQPHPTSSAYIAFISGSGGAGAWQGGSIPPPNAAFKQSCVTYKFAYYCIGGASNFRGYIYTPSNSVYITQLNPNAALIGSGLGFIFSYPYVYNAVVTDSTGTPQIGASLPNTLIVNQTPFVVTFPESIIGIDTGQSEAFESEVLGGTGPFTFNYQITNSITNVLIANQLTTNVAKLDGLFAENIFTWVVPTSAAGNTIRANLIITDGSSTPFTNNTVESSPIRIFIAPSNALVVATNLITDSGQTETLTPNVIGGVSPYTFNLVNVTSGRSLALSVGGPNTWTNTTQPTFPTAHQSCVTSGSEIYCVTNENDAQGLPGNAVYSAAIQNNGQLGSWSQSAFGFTKLRCIDY